MELDVSSALSHPGQEFPFSGTQAIADQEIYGTIVRIDDCLIEGTFMADDEGNINVKGRLVTRAHAPCANCLKDASCILAEVVDPCSQSNPEEKITCERRIRFYLNSGLQNTGVRVNTFGVSYLLLEAPNASRHSIEDVRQIYAMIYRSILPDDVFPLKVHI